MSEILLITDLLDIRARKQKELDFYTEQLQELRLKMVYIQQEITLTNQIIDMIEKERIVDIGLHIKKTL
jgi:predicted transcriptional regulator